LQVAQVITPELQARKTELAEIGLHLAMDRHQQRQFRLMQETLTPQQILIVMDFGTHEVKEADKMGTEIYSDLIFVLYWRDATSGMLMWEYIDCIGTQADPLHQKKDLGFVTTAFSTLFEQGRFSAFSEIFIWSDCGPQHFRASNTLYLFSQLQRLHKKRIVVCFFFPRHGHNPADRHHGSTKRHLEFVLKHTAETKAVPGRKQLVDELRNCTKTMPITLEKIAPLSHVVKTLDGIQKYLVFTFPDDDDGLSIDCSKAFGAASDRLRFTKQDNQ